MTERLVTCYQHPDLDGFACVVGYCEYLKQKDIPAVAGIFGIPQAEVMYVMQRFGFDYPPSVDNPEVYQQVVLVDANISNGIDPRIKPERIVEIIDHHQIIYSEKELFPHATLQIEAVGAAATLMAEKFQRSKSDISQMSATLLYGAIISNTLNFQAKVTTDRDRKMAAWLNSIVGLPDSLAQDMFAAKSDLSGKKLQENLEGQFAWVEMEGKRVGIAQLEIIGAEKLLQDRLGEVAAILEQLKQQFALDINFLSIIDLSRGFNLFVADEANTQSMLGSLLGVRFEGQIARREGVIMRKEIAPMLKKYLRQCAM